MKAVTKENSIITLTRSSNIELLRIIAMFMILIVHATFLSIGIPTRNDIETSFWQSLNRYFVEALSIVCVNVFVLISGWFGISVKMKSWLKLVFQVYFISLIVFFGYVLSRGISIDQLFYGFLDILFFSDYWFIVSYLILYLISPILNIYVEKTSNRNIRHFLILFFLVETLLGGVFYDNSWFARGYSPLSFMGLYIMARYIRKYSEKVFCLKKRYDLTIYVSLALFTAVMAMLLTFYTAYDSYSLYSYSSPLVVISSIYLFLFFTKFSFQSKFINWIAASSLSVYIFHCNPKFLWGIYCPTIRNLYDKYDGLFCIVYILAFMFMVFMVSIILDQLRIFVWNKLQNIVFKN